MAIFSPIRVFLVDDSPLTLELLKRMLATDPDIEIVGTARHGEEALRMFPAARPKVICTDLEMPVMDGLTLIKKTMVVYARPILVVSSLVGPDDYARTFPLLQAGAIDVFAKPRHANDPLVAAQFVQKIKLLAGVFVISRREENATIALPSVATSASARLSERSSATSASTCTDAARAQRTLSPVDNQNSSKRIASSLRDVAAGAGNSAEYATTSPAVLAASAPFIGRRAPARIVAIGASTGGPQTLQEILGALPADFPVPIVCVQHISNGFLAGMVDWLARSCRVKVKIAQMGEAMLPGTVYFPPEQQHLEIDRFDRLVLSPLPPVGGHRPSVTVTFNAVAKRFGNESVGVLLTGMGDDGASGLLAMLRAGAFTIAQDEASCVVFGMPRQAIELGAAQSVLSPTAIVPTLMRLVAPR